MEVERELRKDRITPQTRNGDINTTNVEAFQITGTNFADTITGGNHDDMFTGGAGDARLGGRGDDILMGVLGQDMLKVATERTCSPATMAMTFWRGHSGSDYRQQRQ